MVEDSGQWKTPYFLGTKQFLGLTLNKQDTVGLEVFEVRAYKKMLKVKLVKKVRNE